MASTQGLVFGEPDGIVTEASSKYFYSSLVYRGRLAHFLPDKKLQESSPSDQNQKGELLRICHCSVALIT
jgi:sugar lactone lactonase YvrE